MKKPLVSIIIVNWDGGMVFGDCLKSLLKIDYPSWELIVVDNGSTDGSLNLVHNFQFPGSNLQIIENSTNLGFAEANNQGYRKSRGEYVLFLNNDTKVEKDLLTKLVERMEKEPDLGVIQPKIYLMDHPSYLDNAGSFLTRLGFLEHWGFERKDSQEYSRERIIFSAKGACMLTRREIIEEVGLFDSDFISYFEDSDFCWRVWLTGWKVLFYPKVHVYHKVGFSSKRMDQALINSRSTRNRILSLFKNLETKNLIFIFLPHICIIQGLGLYFLLKLKPKMAWMFFSPLIWNVIHFKNALEKRCFVQKMRKVSDDQMFKYALHKSDFKAMFKLFKRVEANF